MSWDAIWEQVFREQDWGKYPPEELIRFVARHFYATVGRSQISFLEVGCGPGANLWYLAREGFTAAGVDGSPTAIQRAAERLQAEGLTAYLHTGDILCLDKDYAPSQFDAVIDVACLQHNLPEDVAAALAQIRYVLKPGGQVFSMLVAAGSYGDPGMTDERFITQGPLEGKGFCHFFTLDEVQSLFAPFMDTSIEYSARSLDQRQHIYKHWVVQAANPL